jgi:cytidylate kinase
MIITIDGPSGTGKSTAAKALAKRLNISYFDTGAMFRALCWYLIEQKADLNNESKVAELLSCFQLDVEEKTGEKKYLVGGIDVTSAIRDKKITDAVSIISMYKAVRDLLGQLQRNAALKTSAVFEGRDMGTAIFPHAEYKFYLFASAQIRAERRYRELSFLGAPTSLDEILASINRRDYLDSTRDIAPLCCPVDAVRIDTSFLNMEEVVELMMLCIKKGSFHETP